MNPQMLVDAGYEAAVDFVNGKADLLEKMLIDLYALDSGEAIEANRIALEHATYCLARALHAASGKGICTFSPQVPSLPQLHYMRSVNPAEFYGPSGLGFLMEATKKLRASSPGFRASVQKADAASEATPVQKFEIVGMPDRRTEVMVERDPATQEITKTTHRETDA